MKVVWNGFMHVGEAMDKNAFYEFQNRINHLKITTTIVLKYESFPLTFFMLET